MRTHGCHMTLTFTKGQKAMKKLPQMHAAVTQERTMWTTGLWQFNHIGMLLFALVLFGKHFFQPVRLSLCNPLVREQGIVNDGIAEIAPSTTGRSQETTKTQPMRNNVMELRLGLWTPFEGRCQRA